MWVTPVAINYIATAMDDDAQDGYSDLHYEQQFSLAQQTVFHRKSYRVLTEAGVEAISRVSVEFDPSFQTLCFHTIRILRGGQSINQLNLARIKTIQQEKELSRHIYNGSLTAMLILEDLRKGDVLEYSYSLKGFNPAFGNRFTALFTTQYAYPVYSQYYKVAVPADRSLTTANSLTNAKPRISTTASETVYEWTFEPQPALQLEEGLPSWYDAYPMVMVSEYKSWKEVSDWAQALYPSNIAVSGGLKQKVDELKKHNATPETRLLAALHFVQDEVRYMGVEMGESGYKPHSPAQVFQQRFGDCKDKSYLLCTMLRAMGIEAWPVYINTTYKKTVAGWLPSPTAFDHVTVCASLNAKQYWFDATSSHQRGSLNDISYPNYQAGLVIAPGSTGFTDIPLQNRGKVFCRERFITERAGGPAQLVVTTQFSGSYADDVRYDFQGSSNREMLKDFKEMYEPYFKKIDADSLRYTDDETTGVFTTYEYYTIRDFWVWEDSRNKISLSPYLINSVIKKPKEGNRRMPFALSYPANYEEHVEVELPEDWPITEGAVRAQTAAFKLDCEYLQASPNRVLLKYRYQTLADHVPANEVADYVSELEKAEEEGMGFTLSDGVSSKPSGKPDSGLSKSSNGFTVAYAILAALALGTYVYHNFLRRKN